MSKYGVISGPYFPVFGPEITSYLDIFHAVIIWGSLSSIWWKLRKWQYSSPQISEIGHAFRNWSFTLMHSAWFSRIFLFNHPVRHFFSNTTQIPHSSFYPWITHPIQYHWTHGNMPIPISRLKMWNRFILDIQEEPFPAIYHAPKPKFLPSGPTLMGLWGSTTFVLFSRKWITKCWQVWPCKKLNQVNFFHSNSLMSQQRV